MVISEKKKIEAYEAISEPIMDLRVAMRGKGEVDPLVHDSDLFRLEIEIWRRLKLALNIKGN